MTNADPFEIPAILDAKLNATARAEARAKTPITSTALLAGLKPKLSQPKPMEKKTMISLKTNTTTKLPVPPPKGSTSVVDAKKVPATGKAANRLIAGNAAKTVPIKKIAAGGMTAAKAEKAVQAPRKPAKGAPKKPTATTVTPKAKKATSVELRADGLRVGSGMATLVDTVCRAKGATNAELCAAVGWAQCLPMMRKACDRAGVKVRTEKPEGEATRYFGTAKKK
jgi:hypothetical protein